MLSTLLDKLRALSVQSAQEYGPAHLRASEFQENLRIIGGVFRIIGGKVENTGIE